MFSHLLNVSRKTFKTHYILHSFQGKAALRNLQESEWSAALTKVLPAVFHHQRSAHSVPGRHSGVCHSPSEVPPATEIPRMRRMRLEGKLWNVIKLGKLRRFAPRSIKVGTSKRTGWVLRQAVTEQAPSLPQCYLHFACHGKVKISVVQEG